MEERTMYIKILKFSRILKLNPNIFTSIFQKCGYLFYAKDYNEYIK